MVYLCLYGAATSAYVVVARSVGTLFLTLRSLALLAMYSVLAFYATINLTESVYAWSIYTAGRLVLLHDIDEWSVCLRAALVCAGSTVVFLMSVCVAYCPRQRGKRT